MLARRFTSDWVTPHVATWRRVLAPIVGKPGVRMLEIGSFEGRSALWFLDEVLTGEDSEIWCIDPWEGECAAAGAIFTENTAPAAAAGRLIKIRGRARDFLPAMADEGDRFDAIYIDGDHRAIAVLGDALGAWEVLKPGGVLIFDDYGLKLCNTASGVDAFLRIAGAERLEVLERGWQVIVRKLEGGAPLPNLICKMHGEPHLNGARCLR